MYGDYIGTECISDSILGGCSGSSYQSFSGGIDSILAFDCIGCETGNDYDTDLLFG